MMNTQEALKMAIEQFERINNEYPCEEIIDICKEALAQPAQEPVAWMSKKRGDVSKAKMYFNEGEEILPLYTHPAPSWQGLSDDEINNLHHKWIMNSGNKDTQYDFARAIEQALKEKNHE